MPFKKSSTEHMTKYKNRIVTFRSQEIQAFSLSNTIFLVAVFRLHTDLVALSRSATVIVSFILLATLFLFSARHNDISLLYVPVGKSMATITIQHKRHFKRLIRMP